MIRRAFLAMPSLALAADAGPGEARRGETLVIYPDGDKFRAAGWISRGVITVGSSAAEVVQRALDQAGQTGGGKIMLEPGAYRLDRPLRIFKNTLLCGSGMSTVLTVTSGNKEGIGILGVMADRCTVTDLEANADPRNATSLAGVVLDNSADCVIERVLCRDFKHFGFQIRNQTAFTKLYGCTACNNQESNFRLEGLNGWWKEARIGSFVPNLINNCYAYGGGHGFDLSNVVCQNLVGCEVYQARGVGFYLRDGLTSILISGCRSFQGKQQAVFVENANEINISSSIFCWQEGHAIELQNCTWGTVSANEIMDSGAGGREGQNKYHIYMHTDVKGIQITGNRLFCWADQLPTKAGIFEAEDCRDNNIVANTINYFTEQGVVSNGKNSFTAYNLLQPEAYPNPQLQPFAKPSKTYMKAQGPFTTERLEEYLNSWERSE